MEAACLTDEDVFQPEIQKALRLASIVKEFHEVIVSRTAIVLDLNLKMQALERTSVALRELRCAWQIQAGLVQRFPEYHDYAQGKGIARIAEEILDKLLQMFLLQEMAESRKRIAETMGHLVQGRN
jgi:hypothetical protein